MQTSDFEWLFEGLSFLAIFEFRYVDGEIFGPLGTSIFGPQSQREPIAETMILIERNTLSHLGITRFELRFLSF